MSSIAFVPANSNLLLPFGKYKGKELKWVLDNDIGYLKWLVKDSKQKGEDFVFKGLNWTKIIAGALAGGTMDLSDDGLKTEDLVVKIDQQEDAKRTVLVNDQSIDAASKTMLKKFILRQDQNVGFATWLKTYAKEAVSFGKSRVVDITGSAGKTTVMLYAYDGFEFLFVPAQINLILERVAVCKESQATQSGS